MEYAVGTLTVDALLAVPNVTVHPSKNSVLIM